MMMRKLLSFFGEQGRIVNIVIKNVFGSRAEELRSAMFVSIGECQVNDATIVVVHNETEHMSSYGYAIYRWVTTR